MRTCISLIAALVATAIATGCATAPKTQAGRKSLIAEADAAVATMIAKDPSLRDFISRGHGYAIFPDVGKAGAIVGGAYGRGVVFEQGRAVGFAELNQGSIGAQLGGQSYSELIVFESEPALNRLKAGNFDIGAEISAVALTAGAAGAARFEDGVVVFHLPKGGLMAAAAVNGQKINFEPLAGGESGAGATSTTAADRPTTRPADRSADDEMQLRS